MHVCVCAFYHHPFSFLFVSNLSSCVSRCFVNVCCDLGLVMHVSYRTSEFPLPPLPPPLFSLPPLSPTSTSTSPLACLPGESYPTRSSPHRYPGSLFVSLLPKVDSIESRQTTSPISRLMDGWINHITTPTPMSLNSKFLFSGSGSNLDV